MIERLQLIASFLHRLRLLIVAAGLAFLLAFGLSLFELGGLNGRDHLIPSLLGFSWAITLFSCASLFLQVPPLPAAGSGFRIRWRIKLRRGLLWLLGIFMIGLTSALLILSYKLLSTWAAA
jgi:hypothetical protein